DSFLGSQEQAIVVRNFPRYSFACGESGTSSALTARLHHEDPSEAYRHPAAARPARCDIDIILDHCCVICYKARALIARGIEILSHVRSQPPCRYRAGAPPWSRIVDFGRMVVRLLVDSLQKQEAAGRAAFYAIRIP